MVSLVGYTGFVGSNLALSFKFDGLYNSKNIQEAFGTKPDILYYSGVPAQKFIANKFPDEDMAVINNAIDNIKKISPKKVVLISTVDVYKNPNGKDENSTMETEGLEPYGKNRLYLEEFVKQNFDHNIVRLPGIYGKNIKKNFIYDFISFIPAMLTKEKFESLAGVSSLIKHSYADQNNGFYKLVENANKAELKKEFEQIGFSALNFTDSRGVFQFYNLKYLYKDIQIAIKNDIKTLNIATQPVSIEEIYKTLTNKEFVNHTNKPVPFYDYRTCHSQVFGGKDGYMQNKDFVLQDIKNFISEEI